MVNINKKIPVAILGSTGTVGQRFVQLLSDHPWFEITALAGSQRTQGKRYEEACHWRFAQPIPEHIRKMVIQPITPELPAKCVFSALPTDVSIIHEPEFAKAGIIVCSNSSGFRQAEDVPLLEVLEVLPRDETGKGRYTNVHRILGRITGDLMCCLHCKLLVMGPRPLPDGVRLPSLSG